MNDGDPQEAILEEIDSVGVLLTQRYQAPLSATEKVELMQGWNKALTVGSCFFESLVLEWRLLCAKELIWQERRKQEQDDNASFVSSASRRRRRRHDRGTNKEDKKSSSPSSSPMSLVEANRDPIYLALDVRMFDAEGLVRGLLDGAIRGLCADTGNQPFLNHGHRPIDEEIYLMKKRSDKPIKLECETVLDYLKLFARCGVKPQHWVCFCEAVVWAMETHTPLVDPLDDGAALPYSSSRAAATPRRGSTRACIRAVAQRVALPALREIRELKSLAYEPAFAQVLPRFWGRLSKADQAAFGELFYRRLLTKHPNLIDYFAKTDMDSLSVHLMSALDLVVKSVSQLGSDSSSPFRGALNYLGERHRTVGVPTYSYALVGGMLIQCLQPLFQAEVELLTGRTVKRTRFGGTYSAKTAGQGDNTKTTARQEETSGKGLISLLCSCCDQDKPPEGTGLARTSRTEAPTSQMMEGRRVVDKESSEATEKTKTDDALSVTAADMTAVFTRLYVEVMSIVYYAMLKQEKLMEAAKGFYETIKRELHWSEARFSKRILEIEHEIRSLGTYHQTEEELEIGAKLAWRNSGKCVGRESWDKLVVRDSRHISRPKEIFEDVIEHMSLAQMNGSGTQPVMTFYRAKNPNEAFGQRFWSSSLCSYAAYEDDRTGEIVGDPTNLELTQFLVQQSLWVPPDEIGRFDMLPIVLKLPGKRKPFVFQLPEQSVPEVVIKHPTRPEISSLGYRWAAIPTISNSKLTLGGIVYENMLYSRWPTSTEIVHGLMERYNAVTECAKAMNLDVNSVSLHQQWVTYELERAVLYSFQENRFTIDDPESIAESFCEHVRRECFQFGRECPGQWSSLAGFVGHLHSSLHYKLRDFTLLPQYERNSSAFMLQMSSEIERDQEYLENESQSESSFSTLSLPDSSRPLILYGSETGHAESIARDLSEQLNLLRPLLMSLNEAADLRNVSKYSISHVLAVCSTFGNGQPPANAVNFFKRDFNLAQAFPVKFAVFALGSTIYPAYCQAGIDLDKKLAAEGLERICALEKADSASDAFETINAWKKMIHQLLLPPHMEQDQILIKETSLDDPPANVFRWVAREPSKDPDRLREKSACLSNSELIMNNGKDSDRSIRKIKFAHPPGIKYESGDHLAVRPENDDTSVHRFLLCFLTELAEYARSLESCPLPADCNDYAAMDWQVQQLFELELVEDMERTPSKVCFQMPTTLLRVIKEDMDLSLDIYRAPPMLLGIKRLLNELTGNLTQEEFRQLLAHPLYQEFTAIADPIIGQDENAESKLEDFVASFPTVFQFFEHFKELFCHRFTKECFGWSDSEPIVKLSELLTILPGMQPRFYSIASSSKVSQNEIVISVGVLQKETNKGVHIKGVCSNYLASLEGMVDSAQICVRRSVFRLTSDSLDPIILVAAGTGISPMLAFLQDRALAFDASGRDHSKFGPIHLFFGCRSEDDFIYKKEILGFVESGMITLHLALSRSTTTKKQYVQDMIAEMGQAFCDFLLDRKTQYRVCGDARMADGCFTACVNLLREYNSMSRVVAVDHLKGMRAEGRWQADVWGIISHYDEAKRAIARDKKQAAMVWLEYFAAKPNSSTIDVEGDEGGESDFEEL